MSTQVHNDMAFPLVVEGDKNWHVQDGLTKREYYACAAMQGILGSDNFDVPRNKSDVAAIGELAAMLADALIKALAPAQPVNDNDNESGGKG